MQTWVLIVDDEPMIRESLQAYLEDEGIPAVAVNSGEEALNTVQQSCAFAVCIMDMRLPGMDGNTAIRRLHALRPGLEFLIHTGSSDYTLPPDLRALGVSELRIYPKPLVDMAPLAATVRALLSVAEQRRGSHEQVG